MYLRWLWATLFLLLAVGAEAQPSNRNAPPAKPAESVPVPTQPFAVAVSLDGCWLFVSGIAGSGRKGGIVVLKRDAGRVRVVRRVAASSNDATGLTLTHDGKVLVVATGDAVDFFDVAALTSGAAKPRAGSVRIGPGAASIYVNITADDKLLFVSEERQHAIAVVDLAKARASGYKSPSLIGTIPVGNAPIALTFSPDGKRLYTTSQGAMPDWHWPNACKPEGVDPAKAEISRPEGAVIVVDVARAAVDPAQSVIARAPAGCSPVRMTIDAAGERVFVTARNNNALLMFDAAKLVADPEHARTGSVPVGSAPVPVVLIGGNRLIVGNSNRFAGKGAGETLTVIDANRVAAGAAAILGTIPTGAFPRETAVSSDGRTLFVTNFGSDALQILDTANLPVTPTAR